MSNAPFTTEWEPRVFGNEIPPLEPYNLEPVTDIPIRMASESGAIRMSRNLNLFRLTDEWDGWPARSIVIAGDLEEGKPFAIWKGSLEMLAQAQAEEEDEPGDEQSVEASSSESDPTDG